MNKLIGVALIAALFAPSIAAAADRTGVVKNWFLGKREVVLADNTDCKLAATIKDIPKELAVGKTVTLTYTTEKGANTCSAVAVK